MRFHTLPQTDVKAPQPHEPDASYVITAKLLPSYTLAIRDVPFQWQKINHITAGPI